MKEILTPVLSLTIVVGLALFVMLSGCDESPPPTPSHEVRVDNEMIPAYELSDVTKIDPEDFTLTTLPDGHDYWIFRRKSSDRGYAAMAHSPECKKCQNRLSR